MTFQTEIEIDNNVLISGEVNFSDGRVFVESFALVVWIDGLDYGLTNGLSAKQIQYFWEKLIKKAQKSKDS